ncbi:macrolide family glycosyltransferase [Archangium violaceum]|uniref:macrolide family glycosyltransferase n=1 Tax=Archangium violaceum TaxID=83451 RepID=UPI0036DB118D
MKFVFLPFSAQGHVGPTLPVARELVSRGHEVVYYVTGAYEQAVRGTGAAFRKIDDALGLHHVSKDATGKTGLQMLEEAMPHLFATFRRGLERAPEMARRVRTEGADCVVYDVMSTWGRATADLLRLPTSSFYTTYVLPESTQSGNEVGSGGEQPPRPPLREIIAMLRLRWASEMLHWRHGVPRRRMSELFVAYEDLNIVCVPRSFHPDIEHFDERFLFVGPTTVAPRETPSDFPFEQLEGKPVLLVSMGTTPLTQRPEFYRPCIEAFGGTRWQVVMVVGQGIDLGSLGPIPSNFIVRPYVPQPEILQRLARVFITHGGMNSVMEGMWFGVPMLVFPQISEHALSARRVEEFGCGRALKEDVALNPQALLQAVEAVDANPNHRVKLAEFQPTLREGGGHHRAAEALEQYVLRKREPVGQRAAS